jgi:hypothetical protein
MTAERVHYWSRWILGRHSGQWFRHCAGCGSSERSAEKPAQTDNGRKPLVFDPDPMGAERMDFTKQVFRTPEKFNRFRVKQYREKAAQTESPRVDWRAKQAGNDV